MQRLLLFCGAKSRVMLAIILVAIWAQAQLELSLSDLVPDKTSLSLTVAFVQAALTPAITYEREVPANTRPLLTKVFESILQTIAFALSSVVLAFLISLPLACIASTSWWRLDSRQNTNAIAKLWWFFGSVLKWIVRIFIAFCRSVHELLWAVLFLSAMGLNATTAVLALAIPYAGVFAKVFSEILDEIPVASAQAIRDAGGSQPKAFLFGLVPQAIPDILAYGFYRLECGMRSSAVLGFFGIPTLGYYLEPAFDEQHYHEVWSYLYAMFLLIVLMDFWSGRIRRRLVS